jgi:hypothetical protein
VALRFGILRFYSPDVFARMPDAELVDTVRSRPLGWLSDEPPRPPPPSGRVCAAAFGDSFTYGSEVADAEAWVQLLSVRLGCGIANYAVPGYGLDQAVLRQERATTSGSMMILGIYVEMLRRSVAASWTFYAPQPPRVYAVKPYFTLDGENLRLHPIPDPLTRETLAAHHGDDYFIHRVATPARFPYTLAVARAFYVRVFRTDDYRGDAEKYFDAGDPSGSGVLARRLIDRFARTAQQRGARPVVVMFSHPQRLMIDSSAELQFIAELGARGDLCVIDLRQVLRAHARPFGGKMPMEPSGHYTAMGNRLIADAVAAGLGVCGIAP